MVPHPNGLMALMKKRLLALAIPLGGLLLLASCKGFLDTQPLGSLTDQTFYQTEKDFDAATLGPYSTMLNLSYDQGGLGWWNGFLQPDDDIEQRDPGNNDDFFNWTPSNGDFAWVWQTAYTGIMRANVVLDKLPGASGFSNPATKPRYEAEAKFMRGWWYFVLARNFGNAPIYTTVASTIDATKPANSKDGEIWDLIESDLDFASKNLPANYGSEKGRATKYTALALLGKVQLYRAQWFNTPAKYQAAVTNLAAAMAGPFSLTANYGDNFDESKENNSESLFEVQDTKGDNVNAWGTTDTGGAAGHAWTILVSPSCFYGSGGGCAPKAWGEGYGTYDITPGLANEFEQNDPRKYYTMYSTGEDYGGTPYNQGGPWTRTGHSPAKYNRPWDPNRYPNNLSTNNLRLIRLSDVMLLLAEAKALSGDVGGGAILVNRVRARARTTPVNGVMPPAGTLPDVAATGSGTDFVKNVIVHERRVELATEDAHRYDDLVRWHKASLLNMKTDITWGMSPDWDQAKTNWSTKNLLKPIPQGEMDLNPNLKQNTGY